MICIKFDQKVNINLKTKFWTFEDFRVLKKPFKTLVFSKPLSSPDLHSSLCIVAAAAGKFRVQQLALNII